MEAFPPTMGFGKWRKAPALTCSPAWRSFRGSWKPVASMSRRAFAGDSRQRAIARRSKFVILRDEIGHVVIGNRWYKHLCEERNLDPQATFDALALEHRAPRPHLPLNRDARLAAGFHDSELDRIEKGS